MSTEKCCREEGWGAGVGYALRLLRGILYLQACVSSVGGVATKCSQIACPLCIACSALKFSHVRAQAQ